MSSDGSELPTLRRLKQLPEQPSHSIHKVQRRLRDVNNEAYEPQLVAIGPYHHGKPNLKEMEELKLCYFRRLLRRKPKVQADRYFSVIKDIAVKAHDCYAEEINLGKNEFIEMLVLDGCFIIELIVRQHFIHNERIFHGLEYDLILLENQIPFFVLCKLFDVIEGEGKHDLLMKYILFFCGRLSPGEILYRATTMRRSDEVKHILDLVHSNWYPPSTASKPDQLIAASEFSDFPRQAAPESIISFDFPTASKPVELIRTDNNTALQAAPSEFRMPLAAPKSILSFEPEELELVGCAATDSNIILQAAASEFCISSDSSTASEAGELIVTAAATDNNTILQAAASEFPVPWAAPESPPQSKDSNTASMSSIIPSAEQLKDANVQFKKKEYDGEPYRFHETRGTTVFDVTVDKGGVMLMPPLKIFDGTESMLRNLIAFEQYLPLDEPARVTDYAILLDRLVNTPIDVQILSHCGIIENHLGSDKAVVDFVNKLTDQVLFNTGNFQYSKIFNCLNKHYKKPWNRAVAVLRRDYFNSPWAFLSVSAAVVLLLLTIAQTFFAARGS